MVPALSTANQAMSGTGVNASPPSELDTKKAAADRLAADIAPVAAGDRQHRRARRHALLEIGPARRRLVEARALLVGGVLNAEEQGLAVGREGGTADFGAARAIEEATRGAAPRAAHLRGVEAVVEASRVVLPVCGDPDPPPGIEGDVV